MSEAKQKHTPTINWWSIPVAVAVVLLALPFILIWVALIKMQAALVNVAIWSWWCTRGRDVLFVYSDSIASRDYIERQVLPILAGRVVCLNWSQRQKTGITLARIAGQFFCKSRKDCPVAVVFRPFRSSRVFRFRRAFVDRKHGRVSALNAVERELFACLGVLDALHRRRSVVVEKDPHRH